jgi:hypothetical protein
VIVTRPRWRHPSLSGVTPIRSIRASSTSSAPPSAGAIFVAGQQGVLAGLIVDRQKQQLFSDQHVPPGSCPHQAPGPVEPVVLELRREHPRRGANRIRLELLRAGPAPLVEALLDYFRRDRTIELVDWKTAAKMDTWPSPPSLNTSEECAASRDGEACRWPYRDDGVAGHVNSHHLPHEPHWTGRRVSPPIGIAPRRSGRRSRVFRQDPPGLPEPVPDPLEVVDVVADRAVHQAGGRPSQDDPASTSISKSALASSPAP